jgi:hypothetical protein
MAITPVIQDDLIAGVDKPYHDIIHLNHLIMLYILHVLFMLLFLIATITEKISLFACNLM